MSFLYTASEIVEDCRVNVSTHTIKSFSSRTVLLINTLVNTFFAILFFTVLWVSLKTIKGKKNFKNCKTAKLNKNKVAKLNYIIMCNKRKRINSEF